MAKNKAGKEQRINMTPEYKNIRWVQRFEMLILALVEHFANNVLVAMKYGHFG